MLYSHYALGQSVVRAIPTRPVLIPNSQPNNNKYLTISHFWIRAVLHILQTTFESLEVGLPHN